MSIVISDLLRVCGQCCHTKHEPSATNHQRTLAGTD
jgi:hypothetical protein